MEDLSGIPPDMLDLIRHNAQPGDRVSIKMTIKTSDGLVKTDEQRIQYTVADDPEADATTPQD